MGYGAGPSHFSSLSLSRCGPLSPWHVCVCACACACACVRTGSVGGSVGRSEGREEGREEKVETGINMTVKQHRRGTLP
jgi:hypothetical protein